MSALTIKQEIMLLRSAVISLVGTDSEGEYRPEFVEESFRTLSEKPEFTFTTPKAFLAHLKQKGA